jgi:hypothetical protein
MTWSGAEEESFATNKGSKADPFLSAETIYKSAWATGPHHHDAYPHAGIKNNISAMECQMKNVSQQSGRPDGQGAPTLGIRRFPQKEKARSVETNRKTKK